MGCWEIHQWLFMSRAYYRVSALRCHAEIIITSFGVLVNRLFNPKTNIGCNQNLSSGIGHM